MTINFTGGGVPPVDVLQAAEEYLREGAELLVLAIQEVRAGNREEIKSAQAFVRDMRGLFQNVMDERTRVEKLRKQVAGIVHGHALDFGAARDEIGSRLARLRDADAG